jgi:thioredoxin 1
MAKKRTFRELINQSDKPVLVDFYADWCGPCQTLSPIVQQVASSMGDRIRVIKVNVDKNQHAAMHYHIRGVPTLIIFYGGKEIWRKAGLMTKRALTASVERALTTVHQ